MNTQAAEEQSSVVSVKVPSPSTATQIAPQLLEDLLERMTALSAQSAKVIDQNNEILRRLPQANTSTTVPTANTAQLLLNTLPQVPATGRPNSISDYWVPLYSQGIPLATFNAIGVDFFPLSRRPTEAPRTDSSTIGQTANDKRNQPPATATPTYRILERGSLLIGAIGLTSLAIWLIGGPALLHPAAALMCIVGAPVAYLMGRAARVGVAD